MTENEERLKVAILGDCPSRAHGFLSFLLLNNFDIVLALNETQHRQTIEHDGPELFAAIIDCDIKYGEEYVEQLKAKNPNTHIFQHYLEDTNQILSIPEENRVKNSDIRFASLVEVVEKINRKRNNQ